LPLVVIFPVAVLGPGDTRATGRYFRMLIDGKLPFISFPKSTLSFIHVEDVIEVIVNVFSENVSSGHGFCASGEKAQKDLKYHSLTNALQDFIAIIK
jgi:nucleoside-diphosphate-sugar epimerase